VRAISREPIPLEEWAVICGVRLQEPLQGVRVGLTLSERDGDGYGSEEQEAGASHSNPEENFTDGIQRVLAACSCRKKGERGKVHLQTSLCILKCLYRPLPGRGVGGSRSLMSLPTQAIL